jgi:hypothetical protein
MPEDEVRIVNWSGVAMLCVILLAVLAFVGAIFVGLYFAVQWLGLQAALAWAAVAGVALVLIQFENQRKREHRRVLADRKREQYFELLEVLQKCFYSQDPVQAARRQKQELRKWSLRLSLIGSDEVVRAWRDFCDASLYESESDREEDGEEDEEEDEEDNADEARDAENVLFTAQAQLLSALRRDCGNPSTRVTRWELAELLDLDE